MRCLITGVAGFIGSTLADRLLADGHEVVGLDAFTTNYDPSIKRGNLAGALRKPDFTLVEGDLLTTELPPLLDGIDWVFHLAGQPGVRDSWGPEFGAFVRNNVQATHRLLEALKDFPAARLVYASSSSVYGNAPLPMVESARPEPVSPYGVTKLTAENLVGVYSQAHHLQAISLRFFTVYGPRQRPDMAFNRFIRAVANGEPIPLYGDGTQSRDFSYVDDVVEACVRAATIPSSGDVVNVGGGSNVTINEVLEYLGDVIGVPLQIHRQPRQRGDAVRTSASTRRAQSLLGWYPSTSWKEGLRRQVDWQLGPSWSRSRPTRGLGRREASPNVLTIREDGASRPVFGDAPPRVLIYGHDTYGLGHFRRNLAIAKGLTQSYPDVSVLLLTGSPAAQSFELPPNVDYVKLPAVVKVADEEYRSRTLPLQPKEIVRMRASLIRETMIGFAPDVVLVDHAPGGMKGELIPALEALRGIYPRTRVALGLRDVVDEPERVRSAWESQAVNDIIERLYDTVFVYGSPDVVDLVDGYGLSSTASSKLRYCGYLRRDASPIDAALLRAEIAAPEKRLVVVTAGGGGDGYPLLSAYLDGIQARPLRDAASLIVTGPFMAAAQRHDLERRAADSQTQLVEFTDQLPGLLAAADLVVTMGGYNTLCEILSVGVPSLVVPRVEPRREQLIRARAFAERGLVSMLHPDDLTPLALRDRVQALLDDADARPRTRQAIAALSARGGLSGLDATVEAIGELIGEASPAYGRRKVAS